MSHSGFFNRKGNMEKLEIYRIQEDYIEHLHQIDSRVQFNKLQKRPYVGIVLTVGSYEYFVPLESPKPSHAKLRPSITIMLLENGRYGLMGFNNMIPAPKEAIIPVNINAEPDMAYRNLLWNQSKFINKNKANVLNHASKTYYNATNGSPNNFFKRHCCDFKALESALEDYIGAHTG